MIKALQNKTLPGIATSDSLLHSWWGVWYTDYLFSTHRKLLIICSINVVALKYRWGDLKGEVKSSEGSSLRRDRLSYEQCGKYDNASTAVEIFHYLLHTFMIGLSNPRHVMNGKYFDKPMMSRSRMKFFAIKFTFCAWVGKFPSILFDDGGKCWKVNDASFARCDFYYLSTSLYAFINGLMFVLFCSF